MRWFGKWENDGRSQARRLIEVSAAVALWISLGLGLRLSPNAYLLLGIPLTAAFQLLVRRAPIRALWLRDAPPFRLGLAGWAVAALVAAYPCVRMEQNLRSEAPSANTLWFLAAIAGAIPAAYTLRRWDRVTSRHLWFGLGAAGVFGVGFVLLSVFANGMSAGTPVGRIREGVTSLLLYIPVVFLLEEVSFRGAFDSHVWRPGEPREYLTAFAVSALWGLWHIPVAGGKVPLAALIPSLLGVHIAIGYPLSITWRRSGNLMTVGFVHSVIDAVRNALLF